MLDVGLLFGRRPGSPHEQPRTTQTSCEPWTLAPCILSARRARTRLTGCVQMTQPALAYVVRGGEYVDTDG